MYTNLSACETNCIVPSWDCDGHGNCLDPGTGNGIYTNLSACETNCIVPSWDCDGQGNCLDPGTGNGIYTNLSACETNCIVPSWDCDGQGNCIDPGTGQGLYSNLNDCELECINVSIDVFDLLAFKIYPNPSENIFNITFTSQTIQDLRVRVLNIIGKETIIEDLQQFVGEYVKTINLDKYSKGIYFLEIETKNGIINKKLILQ
jgi:ferredoxin